MLVKSFSQRMEIRIQHTTFRKLNNQLFTYKIFVLLFKSPNTSNNFFKKMTIHKEGYPTILLTLLVLGVINYITHNFLDNEYQPIKISVIVLSAILVSYSTFKSSISFNTLKFSEVLDVEELVFLDSILAKI